METFTELKDFVENPHYYEQRQKSLGDLDINTIDPPIIEFISILVKLPYCFTLQSCYGHFLYKDQKNPYNVEPLPTSGNITRVEYRIAYIALCIENSSPGRELFECLKDIPVIDSDYIQFGCAEWFWGRQVNSYALQVEPRRYMTKDKVWVDYQEALHIEKTKILFFAGLWKLLQSRIERQ